MRGWESRRRWPPPPCVEEEEDSLSHELLNGSTIDVKSDDEAQSRGAVDQYPIILEVGHRGSGSTKKHGNVPFDQASASSQSSDESAGPPTPRSSSVEHPRRRPAENHTPDRRHRESQREEKKDESDKQEEERRSRHRPSVSRIDTDVDGEIKHMLSGQRRAPSPYRMVRPEKEQPSADKGRFAGDILLSPEAISSGYGRSPSSNQKPSSSQHSKERVTEPSSSEDSEKPHHRRRSTRVSFSSSTRPEVVVHDYRTRDEHRSSQPTSPLPDQGNSNDTSYDKKHKNQNDSPEYRRSAVESPYSSSKEEASARLHESSRVGEKSSSRTPRPSFSHSRRPTLDMDDRRGSSDKDDDRYRTRKDEYSDSERRRTRMDSTYLSSADESRTRHRERSRRPPGDESSRRYDHSDSEKKSRLELPNESSSEDSRHHRRDRSRRREKSSTRSSRPSISNVPRPKIETHSSRGSIDSSPIEYQSSQRRHRHDSDASRYEQEYDRRSEDRRQHRGSLVTPIIASAIASTVIPDWDKAFRDNQSKHSSQMPSTKTSPQTSPPQTPRSTKSTSEHFSSNPLAIPRQPISRSRAPSRSGTFDETILSSSDRGLGIKSPPVVSHSPRPASVMSTGSYSSVPSSEPRTRPASTYSPVIEQRPIPRTAASFGPSAVDPPKPIQRAFSYSTGEHLRHEEPGRYRQGPVTILPGGQRQRAVYSTPSSQPRTPIMEPSSTDLPACPRSRPVAGHYDWYTIDGLPQLNFCPTCMRVLGSSKFRNFFVPSSSTNGSREISCSLSQPWIRMGWIQTIKQRLPDLIILRELVETQEDTKPCPGNEVQVRSWYTLYDSETGKTVSNCDACSSCVRFMRSVFPQCRNVFIRRDKDLQQEKKCTLRTDGKRFGQYLELLESTAARIDSRRQSSPDTRDLVRFARQSSRIMDCIREVPRSNTLWHFIPQLPELTICEDCYHSFIWPIKDRPIANMVIRSLQQVPGTDRHAMISCQLYSDRMRKAFQDAVANNDFAYLQQTARRRYQMEGLLTQKIQIISDDINQGIDRRDALAKVEADWKAIE